MLLLLAPAGAQDQRPVFRAGVDLVTVDAVVLDRNGRQVNDLTASDFVVVAGGRPRRLVSAEYIRTAEPADSPEMIPGIFSETPDASSNVAPAGGRSFLFVVDIESIRAGGGRAALAGLSAYLDRLSSADRVGLVALPYGSPRVDLTTDRNRIRTAAGQIAGASQAARQPVMTFGEADAIRRGDTRALVAFWERAAGAGQLAGVVGERCPIPEPPVEEPLRVPVDCAEAADQAIERHRRQTRQLFDTLRALADAMAPLPGPKTLVLVSEGTLNDEDTLTDLRRFAAAAERARVSLYALHLDAPLMEASGGRYSKTADSLVLDDRLGFDGMAELAASARGTAFRVIGSPTPLLERVDHETSGYYLLSFERDAADRDRARLDIKVQVTRDGLDVRARREVAGTPPPATPERPASARPADRKAAMGELLKWPVPVAEMPLHVATFATPARGDEAGALVVVAAELDVAADRIAAVGYEITDAAGKPVADTFDDPPAVRPAGGARAQYLVAVPLGPGPYRLKVGAIDRDGRRASAEHAFTVTPWARALRVGDLMFGDDSGGAFRPSAVVLADQPAIVARVDIRAGSAVAFSGASATIRIARVGDTAPAEIVPVGIQETAEPARRVVSARLDARAFTAGDYIVTVIVTSANGEVMSRSRRLHR